MFVEDKVKISSRVEAVTPKRCYRRR